MKELFDPGLPVREKSWKEEIEDLNLDPDVKERIIRKINNKIQRLESDCKGYCCEAAESRQTIEHYRFVLLDMLKLVK